MGGIGRGPGAKNLPKRGIPREGRVEGRCPLRRTNGVGFCPSIGSRLQKSWIAALSDRISSKLGRANRVELRPAGNQILLQFICRGVRQHAIHFLQAGLNFRQREFFDATRWT